MRLINIKSNIYNKNNKTYRKILSKINKLQECIIIDSSISKKLKFIFLFSCVKLGITY